MNKNLALAFAVLSSAMGLVPKITESTMGPTLAPQNLTLPPAPPPPQNLPLTLPSNQNPTQTQDLTLPPAPPPPQNLPLTLPSNQNPTQTQDLTQTPPPPQNNTNPQPENKKDRNPFIPFLAALTISGATLLMLCTCMCCKRYYDEIRGLPGAGTGGGRSPVSVVPTPAVSAQMVFPTPLPRQIEL